MKIKEALRESEERYRTIVETANDLVWTLDTNGTFTFINKWSEEFTGYKISNLLGTSFFPLVHPEDLTKVKRVFLRTIQGTHQRYEIRIYDSKGKIITLSVNTVALISEGKINGTVSFGRDITERKKMEEELKKTRDYLDNLFYYANAPVIVWDPQFKITRFNPAFELLTGRSAREVIGQSLKILFSPELVVRSMDLIRKAQKGERWETVEINILHVDGSVRVVLWNSATVLGIDGKTPIATIAQGQDITERKRAEEELTGKEKKYRELFDSAPDAIFLADIETGKIIDSNPAASKMLQKSREEIIGIHHTKLHPADLSEDSKRKFETHLRANLEGKSIDPIEHIVLRSDGTKVPVEIMAKKIHLDGRQALQGVFRDITERRQAEEAVRESEERFRLIAENTADTITVLDLNLNITYVSPSILKLRGYTVQEAITQSLDQILTPVSLQKANAIFANQMALEASGKADPFRTVSFELEECCKDGSTIWVEVTMSFLRDNKLEPTGIVTVTRDMTERKRVEEALRVNEEIFSQFMKHSPIYVFFKDDEIKSLRLSANYEKMLGKPLNELLGKTMYDLFPSDFAKKMIADDKQILKEGKELVIEEEFNERYYTTIKFPIHIEGKPLYLAGYTIDNTENMRAEATLRQSEEKYRTLIDNIQDGVFIILDAKMQFVNEAFARMVGYAVEEVIGMDFRQLIAPEDLEMVADRYRRRQSGEDVPKEYEFRMLYKDGKTRIFVNMNVGLIDFRSRVASMGTVKDITERKRAEEELKLNEMRLQLQLELHKLMDAPQPQILDFVNEAILKTAQSKFAFVGLMDDSESVMTIHAWSKDTMAQCAIDEKPIYFPIAESGFWGNCIRERKPIIINDYDASYPNKKGYPAGHVSIRRFMGVPIFDGDKIVAVAAVANKKADYVDSDVTAITALLHKAWEILRRKQAEEKLQAAEKRYRALIEKSSDVIALFDSNGRFLYESPAATQILGYAVNELKGRNAFELVHPDDLQSAAELFAQLVLAPASSVKVAFRFRHKDGSWRYLDAIGTNMLSDPDIQAIIINYRDVTERMQAEDQLRLSEITYRGIIDSVTEAIYIQDENGFFIDVNLAAEKMYGYDKEYFVGRTPEFLSAPGKNDLLKIAEAVKIAFDGEPQYFEFWGLRKDGAIFPKDVSLTSGKYFGRKVVIAIARDITERKRAEEEITMLAHSLRSINECVSITDTENKLIFVNKSFLNTYGYSEEELIGKHISIVGSPNNPPELVVEILPATLRGGWIGELCNKRKDGSEFPIYLSTTTINDKDGKPLGLIGVAIDITERKRAEAELLKLRKAVETSGEVIFMTDRDGIITFVNPEFTRLYGYTAAEVVGKATPRILKSGLIEPDDYELLWQTLLNKHVVKDEIINKTKDDRPLTIESSINPILDERDEIIGFLAIQRDITDRRNAEEKRKSLEAQLQQAQKLESLGTLAGGIAHDFNNILGIIIGHASLLERIPTDPRVMNKHTDAITTAGMRGVGLVKQMLTFARKIDVLIESVKINDIVNEVTTLMGETFPKTITVALHLEKDLPPIDADSTQLHQVILNLCLNARDAMPGGGILTITTCCEPGEMIRTRFPNAAAHDYVLLSVTDTGIGMDEETQRRIFEPFFTTKERGKGTGLGLSLVFGIIENHAGFVTVQSEPDKGATFHCYFPVPPRTVKFTQAVEQTAEKIPGGSETILLVEDEELLRELSKSILESKGYKVITARDGEEGLLEFQRNQKEIRLVISDIGLPKFGGDELYRRLKMLNPQTQMILASGFIEPERRTQFLSEGVKEFIQKPYNLNELLRAVRRVLDKE